MHKSSIGLHKNQLDTPCLVINKPALDHNLNLMQQHGANNHVNIRPHCKTHKCSKLAKLQIEHGAVGVCVAKVSEAEILVEQGIPNILITSPVVTQIKRLF
jgi:D-serine deaminase-like pyridoxal phosphate-dependent protein